MFKNLIILGVNKRSAFYVAADTWENKKRSSWGLPKIYGAFAGVGAVTLAGRNGRLSVPSAFPTSGCEPFMQCSSSSCRLPSSHAAAMAWIWGSCLQSRSSAS